MNENGNSLFRRILPITLGESRFCAGNRYLAGNKCFSCKILEEKIQKNDLDHIRPACRLGRRSLTARKNDRSPMAVEIRSGAPRFDTTQRLT